MATLDWSHCPAVESIPGKMSGAWVFRGTRVPISAIFENLKTSSIDEVFENFMSPGIRFRRCWTLPQERGASDGALASGMKIILDERTPREA